MALGARAHRFKFSSFHSHLRTQYRCCVLMWEGGWKEGLFPEPLNAVRQFWVRFSLVRLLSSQQAERLVARPCEERPECATHQP
jgi:hypothetical protein